MEDTQGDGGIHTDMDGTIMVMVTMVEVTVQLPIIITMDMVTITDTMDTMETGIIIMDMEVTEAMATVIEQLTITIIITTEEV